jgi:hypothetical protein
MNKKKIDSTTEIRGKDLDIIFAKKGIRGNSESSISGACYK